ncbi:MAG: tRNA (adenosine(37)-N6)-threonylcarbamoyltransferase complex dimerization subunit type 1 TsaB [Candidatus Hatepunaea meridiana]|nr:tRNA (adenosine(37)-N6)-threonylcarbamoyltransferase complex dimerization subunit type 1 TsaB [Candidatus Hatepunaea meridiana]
MYIKKPFQNPILLAIETATSVCSVALLNGEHVLNEVTEVTKRRHNETLPGIVDQVLVGSGVEQRDIDVIAVSIGPGSFTGLRVGLSFAKGLALGVDAVIVPVMTLDGLAHKMKAVMEKTNKMDYSLYPLTVARRNEVFGHCYEVVEDGVQAVGDVFLGDAEYLKKDVSGNVVIGGEGADALKDQLDLDNSNMIYLPQLQASAASIGLIGLNIWLTQRATIPSPYDLEPLYLKEFTVRKQGSGH